MILHTFVRSLFSRATPGWVAFRDAIPVTATLKIQRAELKKLAETLPGQPGVFDTRHLKKRTTKAA